MFENRQRSGSRCPWDQRLARVCVRQLAKTPVTPNQLTLATLLISLAGAALLATGQVAPMNWGAGLFVLSRFLDHFDGELARATGRSSRSGYYFDYASGLLGYAALFTGIALGVSPSLPEGMALAMAVIGATSAVLVAILHLQLDAQAGDGSAVRTPSFGGFELEDGIYLLAPVTWLGYLPEFFILAAIGAAIFALCTIFYFISVWRPLH